jgi:hypothetical protein
MSGKTVPQGVLRSRRPAVPPIADDAGGVERHRLQGPDPRRDDHLGDHGRVVPAGSK